MKNLLLVCMMLIPVLGFSADGYAFRMYGTAQFGSEQQYLIGSSSSNTSPFYGIGFSYGSAWRDRGYNMFHILNLTAQTTWSKNEFLLVDVVSSYGIGWHGGGGEIVFEIVGLGLTFNPLYNSNYETFTPPFSLEQGTLPLTTDVSVAFMLPSVYWTMSIGIHVAWKNLITYRFHKGAVAVSDYDHIANDLAIRTGVAIGFDFLAMSRKGISREF